MKCIKISLTHAYKEHLQIGQVVVAQLVIFQKNIIAHAENKVLLIAHLVFLQHIEQSTHRHVTIPFQHMFGVRYAVGENSFARCRIKERIGCNRVGCPCHILILPGCEVLGLQSDYNYRRATLYRQFLFIFIFYTQIEISAVEKMG